MKGQLAFEHGARPELEATVARLGIDFAKHVRPTAAMLWSRITKSRILDIARETFGPAWASARSKYKKPDLARSMEEAFAAGKRPIGIGKAEHAAALAWTMPGFAAFDSGRCGRGRPEAETAEAAELPAEGSPSGNGHGTAVHEQAETRAEPAGGNGAPGEVPAEPTVAEAIDAMNRVPTADGGPRVIVQTAGPVDGTGAGGEAPEVPEFLRGVH